MPARLHIFRGAPAVTLISGDLSATFLPSLGMLGASLRWRRREYLSLHGGLDGWRGGHTTGMPLLAPWANRLGGREYRAGHTTVDLRGARHLHFDPNGLPIHGTLLGRHVWSIDRIEDDPDRGVLVARFPFDTHRALLRSFPFPHELEIEATASNEGLSVCTTIRATGRRRVPVSFGWHPYYRLPEVGRADLVVHLPDRRHLELDDRQLPTGRAVAESAGAVSLASGALDDGYRLGRDRRFRIASRSDAIGESQLGIEFDRWYPFAQVYAPLGKSFVAIEPMTAPTNALVTGKHPWVAPGEELSATFRVSFGQR